jgi:hypothetical protein
VEENNHFCRGKHMSEKRSWNSEPAIKQKAYSPEKYVKKNKNH